MSKEAVITEFIELDKSAEFWTVYDEYEKERQEYGQKRYELLLEFAGNYVNYSDNRMDILMEESLANRKSMAKVTKKYYKKVNPTWLSQTRNIHSNSIIRESDL